MMKSAEAYAGKLNFHSLGYQCSVGDCKNVSLGHIVPNNYSSVRLDRAI